MGKSLSLFTQKPEFKHWLEELSAMPSTPLSENLYDSTKAGSIRLANLKRYFEKMAQLRPSVLLIGEAPGYQGTRRTGVPFASEHIINGLMPNVPFFEEGGAFERAFDDRLYKEPTSTIMWRTISQYSRLPLLWAVYPLHPHQLDSFDSNRTPTRTEVASAKNHLTKFIELTEVETVLALGNTAKATLDDLGFVTQKLRHPARGGGPVFAKQLADFMADI